MPRAERFDPKIADDIIAAISHYDVISVDLGERFRESLRKTFSNIRHRPQSFGYVSPLSRGAMISKFPYIVIFRESDSTLLFAGVFHVASDPISWTRRIADHDNI